MVFHVAKYICPSNWSSFWKLSCVC